MANIGRKLYETNDVESQLGIIEDMYRNRATHKQVAAYIGVSERTVVSWIAKGEPGRNGVRNPKYDPKYRKFYETYLKGKSKNVSELKSKAYDMALGGLIKKTTKRVTNPDGSISLSEIEETQLPHTAMLQFLLKNLAPDEFGDKQEIKHSGSIGHPVLSGVDDDTLAKLKRMAEYQQQVLNSQE